MQLLASFKRWCYVLTQTNLFGSSGKGKLSTWSVANISWEGCGSFPCLCSSGTVSGQAILWQLMTGPTSLMSPPIFEVNTLGQVMPNSCKECQRAAESDASTHDSGKSCLASQGPTTWQDYLQWHCRNLWELFVLMDMLHADGLSTVTCGSNIVPYGSFTLQENCSWCMEVSSDSWLFFLACLLPCCRLEEKVPEAQNWGIQSGCIWLDLFLRTAKNCP